MCLLILKVFSAFLHNPPSSKTLNSSILRLFGQGRAAAEEALRLTSQPRCTQWKAKRSGKHRTLSASLELGDPKSPLKLAMGVACGADKDSLTFTVDAEGVGGGDAESGQGGDGMAQLISYEATPGSYTQVEFWV